PAEMESAIARKFEPRPESRMPSFALRVSGFKGDSVIHRRGTELRVHHFAITLNHATDDVTLLACALDHAFHLLVFVCGDHENHADSHVDGAHHLFLRDVA